MAEELLFDACLRRLKANEDITDLAQEIYNNLSDEERLSLLDGDEDFVKGMKELRKVGYSQVPYVAGTIKRVGLRGFNFADGPRGCVTGSATAFPVAMARAATFDLQLEEDIGKAMGKELRAQGRTMVGAPCINLVRHPAWGRSQESYGEDPFVLGEMGAALVRGIQTQVMACAKHFALNSMENSRFWVDVQIDDHALHEAYLPHFKRVVDEGVDCLMSAYNSVNGDFAGQHPVLLNDILRDEWGFKGFVISDWIFGLRDPVASVNAGLNIEMPFRQQRYPALPSALVDGRLKRTAMEKAATQFIAGQLRYYDRMSSTPVPSLDTVASTPHRSLARKAAAQSMVLLKNDTIGDTPLLPLSSDIKSVAVIGALAKEQNLGDEGSSKVAPRYVRTILEGFEENESLKVQYHSGVEIEEAANIASSSDIAVVVVGLGAKDEGEFLAAVRYDLIRLLPGIIGSMVIAWIYLLINKVRVFFWPWPGGDRKSLYLRPTDSALIKSVVSKNPNTIVVLIGGSTILLESEIRNEVPSILMAWYPGMEGGLALQDVITGRVEPQGRLPFVIPESEQDLPFFDVDAEKITYDRFWGYRLLNKAGKIAAYPFGYGLGYGRAKIESLKVAYNGARNFTSTVKVSNGGKLATTTVIQIYAGETSPRTESYKRVLVGFQKVLVEPSSTISVDVNCKLDLVGRRDPKTRFWSIPAVHLTFEAGQYEGDKEAKTETITSEGMTW